MRLLLALILALPLNALAWDAPGHRVIAEIAWQNLSPEARAAASEILAAHPDFDNGFDRKMPRRLDPASRDQWIFWQAAAWPNLPSRSPWYRPSWHLIGMPLFVSPEAEADLAGRINANDSWDLPSSATADTASLNLVQAMKLNRAILESGQSSQADKAVALSWLLHLAGELHQPLSVATMYGFPGMEASGDDNGQRSCIRNRNGRVYHRGSSLPLHGFWNIQVSRSEAIRDIVNSAEAYTNAHGSRFSDGDAKADVADWITGSVAVADEVAYPAKLREDGMRVLSGKLCNTQEKFFWPPKGYVEAVKETSHAQAVIAGQRTAAMVESLLN